MEKHVKNLLIPCHQSSKRKKKKKDKIYFNEKAQYIFIYR